MSIGMITIVLWWFGNNRTKAKAKGMAKEKTIKLTFSNGTKTMISSQEYDVVQAKRARPRNKKQLEQWVESARRAQIKSGIRVSAMNAA